MLNRMHEGVIVLTGDEIKFCNEAALKSIRLIANYEEDLGISQAKDDQLGSESLKRKWFSPVDLRPRTISQSAQENETIQEKIVFQ